MNAISTADVARDACRSLAAGLPSGILGQHPRLPEIRPGPVLHRRHHSRGEPVPAEALSPAGARGVMQVMPATGEWIAQNIRMPGFDRARLFESDTAINLGTWYISHLMKRFKNDPLLVAAAYNAGPEAVSGWLDKNGRTRDRDEFVEAIPIWRRGDMSRRCCATMPSTGVSTGRARGRPVRAADRDHRVAHHG